MVMILSATFILIPVPMSNIVPALVIALISMAYLEADGLLLTIAILFGIIVLGVAAGMIWEIVAGTKFITHFWQFHTFDFTKIDH
jgi:hypothetical protein